MKLSHALIAGLVACSFAVAGTDSASTTAAAPMAKTATPKAKKAAAMTPIKGSIVSVDAIANTIVVKTKKADDTLSTTDKTVVMPKGKTVADLKADDKVMVTYKVEDGKWIATKISIMPAKKAAPAAAPAAPTSGTTTTPEAK
jgi:hypothetical protein